MPRGEYGAGAEYYGHSVEMMRTHPNVSELRNMQLNYAIAMCRDLSTRPGSEGDRDRFLQEVRRLSAEMDASGDARAAKGRTLLAEFGVSLGNHSALALPKDTPL